MASAHWRTGHNLNSLLQQADAGWNFFQLVRLLMVLKSAEFDGRTVDINQQPEGKSDKSDLLNKITEKIQFRASLAADFSPSAIRHVNYKTHEKSQLLLSQWALETQDGPLPEAFTSWISERISQGDNAMADFINIFSNRLLALRYLITSSTQPSLMANHNKDSESERLLLGLIGQTGTQQSVEQLAFSSNLDLAGLTANRRLSLPVVQQMLKVILGLTLIKMTSLQGGWLDVDPQDHAYLGQGFGCCLGDSAVLGRRVWDQQKAIELLIGPISWSQLCTLIPGGQNHDQLVALLKRITDGRCDCKVSFECPMQQVPVAYLHNRQINERSTESTGFSLGLTSFLNSKKSKPVEGNTMTLIHFTVNTAQ